MPIQGVNANLGPESKEWERLLEKLILKHESEIGELRSELRATAR